MQRTTPPFRADHVGSLLRSAALKDARAKRERNEITAEQLKAVEDREIDAHHQEAGGGRAQVDHRRRDTAARSWQTTISSASSTASRPTPASARSSSRARSRKPMMLRVTGKLGSFSGHPMIEHFSFVQAHTRRRRR